MNTVEKVAEFHRAFGHPHDREPGIPATSAMEIRRLWAHHHGMDTRAKSLNNHAAAEGSMPLLRLQLIQEELAELAEAMAREDLVAVLDALCDLQVVVDGTFLAYGLDKVKDEAFAEIMRANMSKLDADGNPIVSPSGRIVKSDLYEPPHLLDLLGGEEDVEAEDQK